MADTKIENLTELTTVADADVIAIVDDPAGGSPITKKITKINLVKDISNSAIATGALIDYSKLAALTDGNILVGNGSNVAVSVNPSGDIDVSNAGVFSIASGVIVNADLAGSIALSKLTDSPEANATADQTGAEIKTAYEAETNAYTDTKNTKLSGIATSANNYVHPNHSGDVTSSADGATTIVTDAVDIAMLSATGTASSSTYLRGDNTWGSVAAGATTTEINSVAYTWFDTTSTSYVDITGFNFTSSNISGGTIFVNMQVTARGGSSGMHFALLKGSTPVSYGTGQIAQMTTSLVYAGSLDGSTYKGQVKTTSSASTASVLAWASSAGLPYTKFSGIEVS